MGSHRAARSSACAVCCRAGRSTGWPAPMAAACGWPRADPPPRSVTSSTSTSRAGSQRSRAWDPGASPKSRLAWSSPVSRYPASIRRADRRASMAKETGETGMAMRKVMRTGPGRLLAVATITAAMAAAGTAGATAQPSTSTPGQWPMAGQNIDDTHVQAAEHAIWPANVNSLAPQWTLTTAGAVSATPTVFAVNRFTGQLLWSTTVHSSPAALITGSPVVASGVVYVGVSSKEESLSAAPGYPCCTFRGAVAALNATTGRLLWKTYTVPSNNSGSDTNLPGFYSGAAVWGSTPVVDPARGLLYVGTGNNYTVPSGVCTKPGQTGCTPPAPGDYADSILALNLQTGAVAWADHTLSSDVWTVAMPTGPDFDFGS